jgi:dihydroorotase
MEYARTFDLPLVEHCEDLNLTAGTCMTEGAAAARAGLRGQPSCAESLIVARDLMLAERCGVRYHVAHASTAETVRLLREAKRRGLKVTCEATPHHLTLTDEACLGYDTATRCNPPLRSATDREALREALADGTIDAVATDHAPHSSVEKELEFEYAQNGMIGLETALALVLELVRAGRLPLSDALARLTSGPARCFGLPGGSLAEGGPADIAVIDLEAAWTVDRDKLVSRSRNTPFAGRKLLGRPILTLCGGRPTHDALGLLQ